MVLFADTKLARRKVRDHTRSLGCEVHLYTCRACLHFAIDVIYVSAFTLNASSRSVKAPEPGAGPLASYIDPSIDGRPDLLRDIAVRAPAVIAASASSIDVVRDTRGLCVSLLGSWKPTSRSRCVRALVDEVYFIVMASPNLVVFTSPNHTEARPKPAADLFLALWPSGTSCVCCW